MKAKDLKLGVEFEGSVEEIQQILGLKTQGQPVKKKGKPGWPKGKKRKKK